MTSTPRRILTGIAALFAAFTLTFAVAACGGGEDDGADSGSVSESSSE